MIAWPRQGLIVAAAALLLALGTAGAGAQQSPAERQYVPLPKFFGAVRDSFRRKGAQARPAASAPSAKRRSPARQPPREAAAARLPKPRPGSAVLAEPGATSPGAEGGPALALATSAPLGDREAQGWLETATPPLPADLTTLPTSFAGAGVGRERQTLSVPTVPAVLGKLDETAEEDEAIFEALPPAAGLVSSSDARAAIESLARPPRARPRTGALLALVDPQDKAGEETAPAANPATPEDPQCLYRLRELGVVFTSEPPMGEGGCAVPAPLKVSSLGAGVTLTPEAVMNCRTTEALARWVRESLLPASRSLLNATPNEIAHGSTYVCRPRNNQAGAKLSEHAIANAVDIMQIRFAEREPFTVEGVSSGSPEGEFAERIRKESCNYFTTVLGPGSDASHANHFHFDMAERRGGHRLCDMGEASTAER